MANINTFDRSFPNKTSKDLWSDPPPIHFHASSRKMWNILKARDVISGIGKTLAQLKDRLPVFVYNRILSAILLQYRYSLWVFPSFISHIQEFLNEEWLALFDFHKAFHRDHIYHQPQVAEIARRVMTGIKYSIDETEIIPEFIINESEDLIELLNDMGFGGKGRFSLLEIASLYLAWPSRKNAYLHSFCRDLKIPNYMFIYKKGQSPFPFHYWKKVIYDAVITAALYHDIGYPFQFQSTISGGLNPLTLAELQNPQDTKALYEGYTNHLFMRALAGYRDFSHYPVPFHHEMGIYQIFHDAFFETHGLPGALTFLYLNDKLRDHTKKWERPSGILTLEMAATAILMHDMQKLYAETDNANSYPPVSYYLKPRHPELRLPFRSDPVSYIVTLADLIQDYSRVNIQPGGPPAKGMKQAQRPLKLNSEFRVNKTNVHFDDKNLCLTITYFFDKNFPHAMRQQTIDFNKKIMAQFFESQNGFLDHGGLFRDFKLKAE